jgi:hypothetical protein
MNAPCSSAKNNRFTDDPSNGAATGNSFQNRREYVHVGSRATSLLRSVLKRVSGARTLVISAIDKEFLDPFSEDW